MSQSVKKKLIVVGNGMVGYKFLEKFVGFHGLETFDVVAYGEEPRPAYDRVHLSEYFSGKTAEDLYMAPARWYGENGITLKTGCQVNGIDTHKKEIQLSDGTIDSYDELVLATGSEPFLPPVEGMNAEGVFVYRTIEDLEATLTYAKGKKTCAVVGGGLLGLEAAKAAVDMGLNTSVVEFASRLMPRQLDEAGASYLKNKIEDLGCAVLLNKNTKHVEFSNGQHHMHFADGEVLSVDMIIVSAGIRPRDELAKNTQIEVAPRGGICVDSKMRTNADHVYAIGECALFNGMIYGLVAPGYRMAEVAARTILGTNDEFLGADMSTKLKLMGIDVGSFGDPFADPEKTREVIVENKKDGVYKKIVIDSSGNQLIGGILVGDAAEYNNLHQICINELPLPLVPESLLVPSSGESKASSVALLPSSAIVCNCENITKERLVISIREEGACDLGSIKTCTKAGTGCGGCVPLINDILKDEMENMGLKVDKTLCEHFSYTRQELYQIVRVKKYTKFDEILGTHGKGDGCEICKPAIASILASCWNEPVLNQQKIQDTNDYYLANIQKNGTYSVVPRVPGGELTPDQLIALGTVAKEFGLYSKITGGQRVDLFGARVEDLPIIWKKLIAAGFESGHAYGKALRTVKSCVGSTWCRFGVQDSTTLAIDLENRYKGFRAPHKLKSAVSGCVRECAEAQSKDFGIIATDKGWNLFVCGNGGAKPQHAKLLMSDVSKEELIRYIDRFLMFYARTADRLTRTAICSIIYQGAWIT
jgi:nitrite reductase (NADH) large subunit